MKTHFSEGDAVQAGNEREGYINGVVLAFDDPDVHIDETGSEATHWFHKGDVQLLG